MSREKQIEEMAEVLRHSCENECFKNKDGFADCEACEACLLYDAGYRKQNEVIDGFAIELKEYLDDTYSTGEDVLIEIHNLIDFIAQKMKGGAE